MIERLGTVATITLNRPDRLNSLTAAMRCELAGMFSEAQADRTVRPLLLTGAGRGFCAGKDLAGRAVQPGGAPSIWGKLSSAIGRR